MKPLDTPGATQQSCTIGTAFFVGPTTLRTAAHILLHETGATIIAQPPGALKATKFVETLFQQHPVERSDKVFYCRLVETLHPKADISVLEVIGTFRAQKYLHVRQKSLETDDTIDILGYLGLYNHRYIKNMHPLRECVDTDMVEDIEELFPKSRLIITHGSVVHGGIQPNYRISTVTGMSGAPVVKDGNAIGEMILYFQADDIGIHTGLGQSYSDCNRCVSFEWSIVWNLLRKCRITSKYPRNAINVAQTKVHQKVSGKINVWDPAKGNESDETPEKTPSRTQFRHVPRNRLWASVPSFLPN